MYKLNIIRIFLILFIANEFYLSHDMVARSLYASSLNPSYKQAYPDYDCCQYWPKNGDVSTAAERATANR
jgi:hypothetical protein